MEEIVSRRLAEMRSVTPLGAGSLMRDFEEVCRMYYERGSDFVQLLFDAFLGQMFDQFMTDFRAEHEEKLSELIGREPEYWRDAEAIFKGLNGELYPFTPMLNINLSTFKNAYVYSGGGAAGPASGGTWTNAYLEEWTNAIGLAQSNESARLDAIKEYAIRRYEPWSPTLLYDNLGWRREIWGNRCGQLMAATFIEKNWQWVFDAFEMNGSAPEIVEEFANENDG